MPQRDRGVKDDPQELNPGTAAWSAPRSRDSRPECCRGAADAAALLITLSSVGGCHQRRSAAAKIEKLAYAFMAPDRSGNLEAFSLQVQLISYERNEEIV
jgi:hypothetical protein